jgi:hypothetical protein
MRARRFLIASVVFVVGFGCGVEPRRDDGGDPGGGSGGPDGGPGGGGGDCAMGTELVYTIDQLTNNLASFDPATKTFHDLGRLGCAVTGGATPFSMSVSRDGVAWVLYSSGQLFNVPIATLACTQTTWASPSGLKVFGMGFSTDTAGGSAEHLFIGGGATQTQTSFMIASVDTSTMAATVLGNQPILPEMTGTGNAQLWGYMPGTSDAHVVRFDKATGQVAQMFDVPTLAGGSGAGYAFAHWGGDYWVFLQKTGETFTTVHQVDGMTGAIKSSTPAPGRTIVGAGVSTCAPTQIL